MKRITIPALLAVTVMIAGIFALMPVEQASTVHTQLQETSTNFVTVTATATTNNDDFIITCPTGSDGCRILEVYLDDDADGITLDPAAATVDLDGAGAEAAFETAADTGAATTANEIIALTGVANTVIPEDATMRIEITPSGDTFAYTLTVIAETEANTTITVDRIAD